MKEISICDWCPSKDQSLTYTTIGSGENKEELFLCPICLQRKNNGAIKVLKIKEKKLYL